jgi:hypothetical protein
MMERSLAAVSHVSTLKETRRHVRLVALKARQLMNVKMPAAGVGQSDPIAAQFAASKTNAVIALLNEALARVSKASVAALLLVLSATPSHAAYLATAYFIHGKGDADLTAPNVALDYWGGGSFINQAKGCTNMPTGYAHYDGTRGLASAWNVYDCGCGVKSYTGCEYTYYPYADGQCGYGVPNGPIIGGRPSQPTFNLLRQGVGEQLYQFLRDTGSTESYVVAHSMGGVVLRNYLSRTDFYNQCFPTCSSSGCTVRNDQCLVLRDHQLAVTNAISTVFTLHSPQTGSEAATAAVALAGDWKTGWIVTWINPVDQSTKDLQLTNMSSQNARYLYGTTGRQWPTVTTLNEPLRTARWIALGSALSPTQNLEDNAHSEDFQLSGCAGALNALGRGFAGNVSDGLVSWDSQMAVHTTVYDQWKYAGQHDSAAIAAGGSQYVGNNHWHAKSGAGGQWRPLIFGGQDCPLTCCGAANGTCYSSGHTCYGCPTPGYTGYAVYACPDATVCLRTLSRGYPLGGDEAFNISSYIQGRTAQRCGPPLSEIAVDSGRRYPIVNTGGGWTNWTYNGVVCTPGFVCTPPYVVGYTPLYQTYSPNSGQQICNAGC